MLHKTEASAHVGIFHLTDHNIEVPLLIFRSTSDMCTIQENGQWRRSGARVFIRRSFGGNVKLLGNASQAISDRRVRLGRTRQEHFGFCRNLLVAFAIADIPVFSESCGR